MVMREEEEEKGERRRRINAHMHVASEMHPLIAVSVSAVAESGLTWNINCSIDLARQN